ncbi:MAG: hypothetical protein OWQ48_04105 [Desulfurococcus sp.]|nr:hypothetical protein [Desulfurococcus sp.]
MVLSMAFISSHYSNINSASTKSLQYKVCSSNQGRYFSIIEYYKSPVAEFYCGNDCSLSLIGSHKTHSEFITAEIHCGDCSLFASPNLWNSAYADGNVNLTYKNGVVYANVNLSNVMKKSPSIPVVGYPKLVYGYEGWWFPHAGTIQNPHLVLPMKVSVLPDITSILRYSLWVKEGYILDFSYDIWLTQNPNTKRLAFPDIELMIWLHHQGEALPPPFIKMGEVQVPIYVNGSRTTWTFTVYVLPHTGSPTGWIGVYYLSNKNLEGEVSIPLTFFIKDEFRWINKVFPEINESQYYLNSINVGMEFNDINGRVELGYTLYEWSMTVEY